MAEAPFQLDFAEDRFVVDNYQHVRITNPDGKIVETDVALKRKDQWQLAQANGMNLNYTRCTWHIWRADLGALSGNDEFLPARHGVIEEDVNEQTGTIQKWYIDDVNLETFDCRWRLFCTLMPGVQQEGPDVATE